MITGIELINIEGRHARYLVKDDNGQFCVIVRNADEDIFRLAALLHEAGSCSIEYLPSLLSLHK